MMDRELCQAMGCRKQKDDGSHGSVEGKDNCLLVLVG